MDGRVERMLELFFEDLPYSAEVAQARAAAGEALEREFEALRNGVPCGADAEQGDAANREGTTRESVCDGERANRDTSYETPRDGETAREFEALRNGVPCGADAEQGDAANREGTTRESVCDGERANRDTSYETPRDGETARDGAAMSGDEAIEVLLKRYGSLGAIAELAGFPAERAKVWRSGGNAKGLRVVRKEVVRQRWRVYALAFLFALAGVHLFVALLWLLDALLRLQPVRVLFVVLPLALFALFALPGTFLLRRYLRRERLLTDGARYGTDACLWLRELSDRYVKRTLNGVALSVWLAVLYVASVVYLFATGGSKDAEAFQTVYANLFLLWLAVYVCLKNLLCLRLVSRRFQRTAEKRFRKQFLALTTGCVGYWTLAGIGLLLFRRAVRYPADVLFALSVVYGLLLLLWDLTVRKAVVRKNLVFNRKRVGLVLVLALLICGVSVMQRDAWYTQPYINATPVVPHRENAITYDDATGVYTITRADDEDFKILHLTDIHLGGSLYSLTKDLKAFDAVYAELRYTRPDLVIVTGDLSFPLGIMSLSLNNSAPVGQFAAFMRNTDIPWAFTYGNHDTESLANLDQSDLDELFRSLSYKTSGNLLYPYVQPDITGRNNQLIEIRNPDGSLNQALFLLDSNAYTGEGFNEYDYIHDDQVEWYASQVERLSDAEGRVVPSMAFFHIPLQQYRTAYELYEAGSGEVEWFFGENNEQMIDRVCCSDHPSALFDRMVELGSTSAVFCGHDHYNNMSLEYRGIRLTYGMSIDYLAMPGIEFDTAQRGAELITLHADSSWDLAQLPLETVSRELEAGA